MNYYCPNCGEKVIVTSTKGGYKDMIEKIVTVTCNTCNINARSFDDKVLGLFLSSSSKALLDSFPKVSDSQLLNAYEAGRRAVGDEDYK